MKLFCLFSQRLFLIMIYYLVHLNEVNFGQLKTPFSEFVLEKDSFFKVVNFSKNVC